jgi:predicted ATP-grasp superfamily ATP-dependent carboligase
MQYLDLTCQKPTPSFKYREGIKWLDSLADFRAFKQYHKAGELGFREWLKSLIGARVFSLFAWDDPLPFLVDRKFGLSYVRIFQYMIGHSLRKKTSGSHTKKETQIEDVAERVEPNGSYGIAMTRKDLR